MPIALQQPLPPPASLAAAASQPRPVAPLAFVFGSPRSGTTWLGKLIDSNRHVAYLHEPIHKGRGLLLHEAIGLLRKDEPLPAGSPAKIVAQLAQHSPRYSQPPFFRKDFLRFQPAAVAAWGWQRLSGRPASPLSPSAARRIRLVVVKDGLSWFAEPLTHALQARTIVLLRHPCGVVSSMLRGQQIGAMDRAPRDRFCLMHAPTLQRLGYAEADVLALAQDEFEALRWLVDNLTVAQDAAGETFRLVVYGDLVARTLEVMEDLFDWLGLGFSPESRRFAAHGERLLSERLRGLLGAKKGYYAITARSTRPDLAWQTELPPDSIRRILSVVAPFPMARFWPELS